MRLYTNRPTGPGTSKPGDRLKDAIRKLALGCRLVGLQKCMVSSTKYADTEMDNESLIQGHRLLS